MLKTYVQGWIIALFDSGVEGVAVQMGKAEAVQFTMNERAPATAGLATLSLGLSQTIAAEAAHGQSHAAPRTPEESPW